MQTRNRLGPRRPLDLPACSSKRGWPRPRARTPWSGPGIVEIFRGVAAGDVVSGPGAPRPDRPERPVEPYEPEPDPDRDPDAEQPERPDQHPTYEDEPPPEPKDEEALSAATQAP